jgi:tRNA-specific 2-thiouridylase
MQKALKYLHSIGLDISEQQYQDNQQKKVIVGMSGGVDSSVSALLLKLQGYQVTGMFMKNWDEVDENGHCSAESDYQDVVAVCEKLDIPYYSINFVEEYQENVFKHFLVEYQQGFTPNPDILCNREIKFKVFFDKAMELGADYLATGHYCQIKYDAFGTHLSKGLDAGKDQTYFLYAINGEVLDRILFPIGSLQKKTVRQVAKDYDLITHNKKDSTGICFIGERNFKQFLSQYIDSQQGNFVRLDDNKIVGPHEGQCFYTIGQRKGLGLGGPGGPWFVAAKDVNSNTVYVVEGEDHPALYADELTATDLTLISTQVEFPLRCKAKIRYRQPDQDCTVHRTAKGLKVVFDKPQRAISARQSVVFYMEDICLGGAIIEKAGQSYFDKKMEQEASFTTI